MDALDRAIAFFGSQSKLAEAVGLRSAMAVSQWRRRGVPPLRCNQIERVTGGEVTARQLRPDVFCAAPPCGLRAGGEECPSEEDASVRTEAA